MEQNRDSNRTIFHCDDSDETDVVNIKRDNEEMIPSNVEEASTEKFVVVQSIKEPIIHEKRSAVAEGIYTNENAPLQHVTSQRRVPLPHPRKNRKSVVEIHNNMPFHKPSIESLNSITAPNIIQEDLVPLVPQKSDEYLSEEKYVERNQQELIKDFRNSDAPDKQPLPRPRIKSMKKPVNATNQPNQQHIFEHPQKAVHDQMIKELKGKIIEKNIGTKNTQQKKSKMYSKTIHHQRANNSRNHTFTSEEQNIIQETTEESLEDGKIDEHQKKIIGIVIHRSDCLQPSILIQHPLIKVHIFNTQTGKYLKKSTPIRSTSVGCESNDVDYMLPIMTKAFDFKMKKSLIPAWEELLLFNEEISYILKDDLPVLIIFEILDFVNFSIASSQYKRLGPDGGWHKIAWAFLKPLGANHHLNVEKKIRLQLYKPVTSSRNRSDEVCDVYLWWTQQIWERYPATLYVTVKGVVPPQNVMSDLPADIMTQEKTPNALHLNKLNEVDCLSEHSISASYSKNQNVPIQGCLVWSRLPAQSCKVPNKCKFSIPTSTKGCFLVKFSSSGLLMACAVVNESEFSIKMYTIPEGKEYVTFVGHQGFVYDLCWSSRDSMLLSSSADCTVCIWDVEKKRTNFLQMLPHPSFVYCAKFHPHRSWLLATGCNDHVVRLWIRQHKANQYDLVQELEGHHGFVNSLCFIQQNELLSADSKGCIFLWSCDKNSFSRKNIVPWHNTREFRIRELKGVVINKLILHPGGQRLLIHSRDSLLRMLDITTGIVIQWFQGAINYQIQTSCCISPCGSLIFSGSEDGTVYVWNADTGELTALYTGLEYNDTVTCVEYHPFEHMVAFSSYGFPTRVLVCVHSKLSNGIELGLQLVNKGKLNLKTIENEQKKNNKDNDIQTFADELSDSRGQVSGLRNNEIPKSGLLNGTSNCNGFKDTPQQNVSSKKKIDLASLLTQMDEILYSKKDQATNLHESV